VTKASIQYSPITVLWELTQRCHLDCSHCYLGDKSFRDELDLEQATTVLRKLRQAGSFLMIMTGGEPTLHPHFDAIAQTAFEMEFAPTLFTAAGNLTPERRKLIGRLPWMMIEVSLLGAKEDHNRIAKRSGAFERTIEDIAYWRSVGRRVLIKTVVWKDNREEIAEIKAIADRLGCDLKASPFLMNRTDTHQATGLQPEDHDETRRELLENLAAIEFLQHGGTSACDGSLVSGAGKSTEGPHGPQQALLCGAGRKAWALAPNADVFPCNILRIPCGNLLQQPWDEIWFSDAMSGVRDVQVEDVHGCHGCGVMSHCKRCPGQAWLESGDYKNRALANCDIASARAVRAGAEITTPFPISA
ncbi:MAG TPA: radical SAM protein, partial [Planctomycetota bacterium]|nr:radical SAM protein [Planctomycetota bacterium]